MAKITWIQPVPVMGSNFNQNDSRYCAWIVKMHTAHNFPAAWHSMYVTKTFCWAWYSQMTHSQYNCLKNKNCAPSVSMNQSITVQVKVGQSQAKKGQTLPRELFAAEWIIRQAPSGTSSPRAIQEINWRRNSEKFSKENATHYWTMFEKTAKIQGSQIEHAEDADVPTSQSLVATACRFRRWVSTLLLKTARASRFSSWRSSFSSSRCFRTSSSGKCSSIEPNRSVLCRIIALRHRRLERSQITSLFRASRYSFCSFDFLASSVFCSMNSLLVSGTSRSSTSFFSFLLKYNVKKNYLESRFWTLWEMKINSY